ncbi:acyl-CoA thioesterase [Solibacillus sp. FSL R5-0691]|uniref:acyl-CoA thioesterase n=1 Tax=Solibacillus sp. FSL R5-0691 TaxID=2921653 RepID=UPI0030CB9E2C
MEESKPCNASRVIRSSRVFPNDFNNHNTLFGGRLLSDMDQVASISAAKHSRRECVTASVDTVEFLTPIRPEEAVTFESFVVWTGTSSMEGFIKVHAENMRTGESKIAAISYFTFIALDSAGKPTKVPQVYPETIEERYLYEKSKQRTNFRNDKRVFNKETVSYLRKNHEWMP